MFVEIYSNEDDIVKRYKVKRCYLPKGAIKKYNVIIYGESFYDQLIDFGINRSAEIRKLTTRQDKDYTQIFCWIMITFKITIYL